MKMSKGPFLVVFLMGYYCKHRSAYVEGISVVFPSHDSPIGPSKTGSGELGNIPGQIWL